MNTALRHFLLLFIQVSIRPVNNKAKSIKINLCILLEHFIYHLYFRE